MYCAIGSPWSPATPGAKYWGAFIPPDAVSIGTPGIEIGAPGRPGFASSSSSLTMIRWPGSGEIRLVSSILAVTVTDSAREVIYSRWMYKLAEPEPILRAFVTCWNPSALALTRYSPTDVTSNSKWPSRLHQLGNTWSKPVP